MAEKLPEVLVMNSEQRPQTDELNPTATQVILMIAGWIALWVVFLTFSMWH
jgi:hypothetical protein